jgi:uncharacterized membrane protein YphA (DoxX/SURF4 family)
MVDVLGLGLRLFIGAVLLVSGLSKAAHPNRFARVVADYRVLPASLSHAIATLIIPIEFVVGITLVLGVAMPVTASAAAALFAVFLIAIAMNLARGRSVACGCFGDESRTISKVSAARLSGLLGGSLLLAAGHTLGILSPQVAVPGLDQGIQQMGFIALATLGFAVVWVWALDVGKVMDVLSDSPAAAAD